ncbi:MAG: carboxypeptidase regulatory-like domain-containing protein [Phycisphaerales bacterium]|nr:carboxypeptidase regulatory-like domain-containing protein [Phycisphaerales bacterium]
MKADASVRGRLTDAAGRPIAGVVVRLTGVPQPGGGAYHTTTDRGGYYLLKHVVPGEYIATALSDSAGRESVMTVVAVKKGGVVANLRLR